jgi:hypothetical protein
MTDTTRVDRIAQALHGARMVYVCAESGRVQVWRGGAAIHVLDEHMEPVSTWTPARDMRTAEDAETSARNYAHGYLSSRSMMQADTAQEA